MFGTCISVLLYYSMSQLIYVKICLCVVCEGHKGPAFRCLCLENRTLWALGQAICGIVEKKQGTRHSVLKQVTLFFGL